MIEQFFIINQGMCIYEYHFSTHLSIDSQMLSGFLSAIGSFAQETFQSGLSSIQIRNHKKLIFYLDEETGLLFCAICDMRDNERLLTTILGEIASRFLEVKKTTLREHPNELAKYEDFHQELLVLMEGKDKVRNKKTMRKGLLAGFFTWILLTFSVILPSAALGFIGNDEYFFLVFFLSQTGILSLSSLIAGYLAGTRKTGKSAGIWFSFIGMALIAIVLGVLEAILPIIPLIIIVGAAAGSYGGEICDRRNLYSLPDEEEEEPPENPEKVR